MGEPSFILTKTHKHKKMGDIQISPIKDAERSSKRLKYFLYIFIILSERLPLYKNPLNTDEHKTVHSEKQ